MPLYLSKKENINNLECNSHVSLFSSYRKCDTLRCRYICFYIWDGSWTVVKVSVWSRESFFPQSSVTLCAYPFLLNAQAKTTVLQTDAELQMQVLKITRFRFWSDFFPFFRTLTVLNVCFFNFEVYITITYCSIGQWVYLCLFVCLDGGKRR